ncbi:MAG: DUF3467 domain-containing protein [Candidatus Dormibacteria bacterium]
MSEEIPHPDVAAPRQLQVQVPEPHAEIAYSDQAFVYFTPVGFNIDFAQMMPQAGVSRVVARIGMSPTHAKLLVNVLAQNLQRFEQTYGAVEVTAAMQEQHVPPAHPGIGFHPPTDEEGQRP